MQDQEAFLRQLRDIFAVEAGEHLRSLQEGLLALGKESHPEESPLIQPIYRAAHSLKGAARAVDFLEIESLCHGVENVFSAVLKKEASFSPSLFEALERTIDAIDSLVRGQKSGASAVKELLADLTGKTALETRSKEAKPLEAKTQEAKPQEAKPREGAAGVAAAPGSKPAETTQPMPQAPIQPAPQSTLRVGAERLEKILFAAEELIPLKLAFGRNLLALGELASELQAALDELPRASRRTALEDRMEALKSLIRKTEEDVRGFKVLADSLMEDARGALMLPCSHIAAGFPKMIRDLSRDLGKEIDFSMEGESLELEKTILERIKDPLVHLLRNCADHGIETPQERLEKGKPGRGRIRFIAQPLDDGMVEFIVRDDGRGVDAEKIKAFALKTGDLGPGEAASIDQASLLNKIFLPGFSTSSSVTDISGRGLGLTIVRERAEELGGRVELESQPGRGSLFRLVLPASRANFRGIVVSLGGMSCIVPTSYVLKAVRLGQEEIHSSGGSETITVDGKPCPLLHLGDLLGVPRLLQAETPARLPALLVDSGGTRLGLLVDSVLGEEEILVKPLGHLLSKLRHVLGAALMGNGDILAVLDLRSLAREGLSGSKTAPRPAPPAMSAPSAPKPSARKKSILVVEDSITSRTLIKSILESSGYAVSTAGDGLEGLAALSTGDFDLLVSDVEMPRMDGFALIQALRADPRLQRLPAILVTSLETREHREKGAAAGANAYISKSDFAQSNLLEAIRRYV